MENKFLQEFLKTGMFDIGDNDERLRWLQQSISDLEKAIEAEYSLLPQLALLALDPTVSETEPLMIRIESIVTVHWKALRAKYPDMPRNILRGVIINALNNVGMASPRAARIINWASLSFYPYAKLSKEKDFFDSMLRELEEIAETDAVAEWSVGEQEPTLKLPPLKVTDLALGSLEINSDKLAVGMKTAIQNEPSGNTGSNGGGNGPWGEHFATTSSTAIADAFKAAVDTFSQSTGPNSIATPVNRFFNEFKKSLDHALKQSFSISVAVERRNGLLWWKETLYSRRLRQSYRPLEKNVLVIVLSLDLAELLPEITPISVEYFLRETLLQLIGGKDDSVVMSDYLKDISTEPVRTLLRPYFSQSDQLEGRISIAEFIRELLNGNVTVNDFEQRTGVKRNERIAYGDLSVAMLRDSIIRRLVRK